MGVRRSGGQLLPSRHPSRRLHPFAELAGAGAWAARSGALGLMLSMALGCGPASRPPSGDLFDTLSAGVFVEYGGSARLGRPPKHGEIPESAIWSPLPIALREGWLAPSRSGWHPIGGRATLDYRAWGNRPVDRPTLRLDLRRVRAAEGVQRVEVVVNGSSVGEIEIAPGTRKKQLFPVPAEAFELPATIELLFEPPLAREQSRRPPLTLLGLGLGDEMSVNGRLKLGSTPAHDAAGRVLRFTESGKLMAPLDLEWGSKEIWLETRCQAGEATLRISLLDRDGVQRGLASPSECRSSWRSQRISLDGRSGRVNTLVLEVLTESDSSVLEIRRPRIVGSEMAAESDAAGPGPTPVRGRRLAARPPDIVLIILDAARAAHFGLAGYPRNTTPNIDRLAQESLVFEHAFSECPNTSCSIPNLISGVPFMNLGTVFHGKRIPDEVTSLAEYLKPLGYRTVGFSSNPNNSVARNSHQGFDHFERLWGAHRQAQLAAETILEQPLDSPLFLQLHLLPPHQPYKPSPEFDLFTAPAYTGPVEPKIGLRRYSAGLSTFSSADLEQLIALYDGNLRMADDAVEQVLVALKRSGRWQDTLVLLTSDHGEAFGEHGDFQHNSTVFDEMLHVPFILRLPGGEVPSAVDTRRLVALADAVPTILGYLGLEPRPEVWGIDLLSPQAMDEEPRFLYHRTFHLDRPLLAIRDERWKAVTGKGLRMPLLFDLASDPEERFDISAERPEVFSGLALRLRDFIADWERRVPQSTDDVGLSSEEIKILRSLGYVE